MDGLLVDYLFLCDSFYIYDKHFYMVPPIKFDDFVTEKFLCFSEKILKLKVFFYILSPITFFIF